MKREQVIKLLKVAIVSTLIILAFEGIFAIPQVNDWFGNLILNSNGFLLWAILWLIMFLQCTILNIPAYVILSACTSIGMQTMSFEYIAVVLSAYMAGCILAYWLGRWFGTKAVKWCAGSEEDFDKWCNVLNQKGKWWYFASVILPIFPDDLLSIVCGSVKFNFGFYLFANFIGRGVGLVTMLAVLQFIGGFGSNIPIMLIVWAVALVGEIIALCILRKNNLKSKIIDK